MSQTTKSWLGPVLGAVILVVGYVSYQEFARNREHRRFCSGLVVQMRMHKGEGKAEVLNKEFDTLAARCPEGEWLELVTNAP